MIMESWKILDTRSVGMMVDARCVRNISLDCCTFRTTENLNLLMYRDLVGDVSNDLSAKERNARGNECTYNLLMECSWVIAMVRVCRYSLVMDNVVHAAVWPSTWIFRTQDSQATM